MPPDLEDASLSRKNQLFLLLIGVGFYALLCVTLFRRIRVATQGHFFFALDDPYIHFALAKAIHQGGYWINAGEPSSPSSSVLWPLLLAPFARSAALPGTALAINIVAGLAAAATAAFTVTLWPAVDRAREETPRRVLAVIALVFAGNLAGLTFLGMEHTLQVALAGVCALGLIRCLQGQSIPLYCLVAAAVAPLVRYECLGLSVAMAIALCGQRLWRRAAVLLTLSILPLPIFSLFLHRMGLPALPLSVLVKANVAAAGASRIHTFLLKLIGVFHEILRSPDYLLVFVLFATFVGLALNEKLRSRRYALSAVAAATGLHLLIGTFNWFHRYEVYVVFLGMIVLLYVLHERPRMLFGWFALGLLACTTIYIQAFFATPLSAQDVYLQQFQTHRFFSDYFTGNVAVNDLGIVAYEKHPNQYVLDLAGLGSAEAAREQNKSAAWLDGITREHQVGAVALYPEWFRTLPENWVELGTLCLARPPIAVAHECVHYYATGVTPVANLQLLFVEFAHTVPAGVVAHVD